MVNKINGNNSLQYREVLEKDWIYVETKLKPAHTQFM